MTITRDGEVYTLVEDKPINERIETDRVNATALHLIKVSSRSGLFHHIAKGSKRVDCFRGLLDSGFTIRREPGEPDDLLE